MNKGAPRMLSRHWGCRLSDEYTWRGLRLLIMENELLRVSVLLDKGADIVELRYKPADVDFLWHSPNPLVWGTGQSGSVVHPEGYFADYYEGCWQEVLPNAGRFCEWRGARFGLHGEVWGLPWQCRILEDSTDRIAVELTVTCRRMPLRLTRQMSLRSGTANLYIQERVQNCSPTDLLIMWGHHPAFGEPFIGPACHIQMPPCQVVTDANVGPASRIAPGQRFAWPVGTGRDGQRVDISRIVDRSTPVDEMYYLTELAEPWYALMNEEINLSLGFAWSGEAFKCVWYWASLGGNMDWPSWGRYYVIALEPMSSWPAILTNAIENRTALPLPAEGCVEEKLTVSVAANVGRIAKVDAVEGIVPE